MLIVMMMGAAIGRNSDTLELRELGGLALLNCLMELFPISFAELLNAATSLLASVNYLMELFPVGFAKLLHEFAKLLDEITEEQFRLILVTIQP